MSDEGNKHGSSPGDVKSLENKLTLLMKRRGGIGPSHVVKDGESDDVTTVSQALGVRVEKIEAFGATRRITGKRIESDDRVVVRFDDSSVLFSPTLVRNIMAERDIVIPLLSRKEWDPVAAAIVRLSKRIDVLPGEDDDVMMWVKNALWDPKRDLRSPRWQGLCAFMYAPTLDTDNRTGQEDENSKRSRSESGGRQRAAWREGDRVAVALSRFVEYLNKEKNLRDITLHATAKRLQMAGFTRERNSVVDPRTGKRIQRELWYTGLRGVIEHDNEDVATVDTGDVEARADEE